jgi:hypothetical protein
MNALSALNGCDSQKEDHMLKESPAFSTIRTPSSYPASRKRYLQGSRSDLRVPYREITLSDMRHRDHTETNTPLPVYDTSGRGKSLDPSLGELGKTNTFESTNADWAEVQAISGEETNSGSDKISVADEYERRQRDEIIHPRMGNPGDEKPHPSSHQRR